MSIHSARNKCTDRKIPDARLLELSQLSGLDGPRLKWWLDKALSKFDLAKDHFDSLLTKTDEIAALTALEDSIKRLRLQLNEPWVKGHMIAFEQNELLEKGIRRTLLDRGFKSVERRIKTERRSLARLASRVEKMRSATKASKTKMGAAQTKQADNILAQAILGFWTKNVKKKAGIGVSSELNEFASIVRALAIGSISENAETTKSWLRRNGCKESQHPSPKRKPALSPVVGDPVHVWKKAYIRHLMSEGMDHGTAVDFLNEIKKIDASVDPRKKAKRTFAAFLRTSKVG